jgi:hypothetical protein
VVEGIGVMTKRETDMEGSTDMEAGVMKMVSRQEETEEHIKTISTGCSVRLVPPHHGIAMVYMFQLQLNIIFKSPSPP